MTDLSNRALLVTLNISQWTARKLDRRESADVNARNGASVDAARVNKSLLPMSVDLDRVHKLTGMIRNEYYASTLPWMEGMQIIRSSGYMAFAQRMGQLKSQWEQAVAQFVQTYDVAVMDAQYLMGGLFNSDDYPPVDTLRSKFRLDVGFYPVPNADDWRVDMADDEMRRLQQRIAADVAEKQTEAMSKAWQRVYDVVSKAHERLSEPKNIFRDSLIDNARELCNILPSLNITDDPALEAMRQEIEGSLCCFQPDDLRKDEALRASVSQELEDIMSKMAGMYGA